MFEKLFKKSVKIAIISIMYQQILTSNLMAMLSADEEEHARITIARCTIEHPELGHSYHHVSISNWHPSYMRYNSKYGEMIPFRNTTIMCKQCKEIRDQLSKDNVKSTTYAWGGEVSYKTSDNNQ